jgi:hypothetical protein
MPAVLMLLSVLVPEVSRAAGITPDAAALVELLAADQDARVTAALGRIEGTDRRLLALRSYLRAGPGLADRWSWSAAQIAVFAQSQESRDIQAEIEKVRQAFVAANPGFELWVNPEVRSLDTQLANWNRNASVARAAARLLGRVEAWLGSAAVSSMPVSEVGKAAATFLSSHVPSPTPTLAAPGLSPHGQMRAVDFQIRKAGRTIAGPTSATIATAWDAAGWAQRLKAAVLAGSTRFTGPLAAPREPWHYTYTAAPVAQRDVR